MKAIMRKKWLWVGGAAGIALVVAAIGFGRKAATPGFSVATSQGKESPVQAIDTKMHTQFPPGTPWAEVDRWLRENRIEHSPLLVSGKGAKKSQRSYALFPKVERDRTLDVHVSMELAFDEHSNLKDMRFTRTFSAAQ